MPFRRASAPPASHQFQEFWVQFPLICSGLGARSRMYMSVPHFIASTQEQTVGTWMMWSWWKFHPIPGWSCLVHNPSWKYLPTLKQHHHKGYSFNGEISNKWAQGNWPFLFSLLLQVWCLFFQSCMAAMWVEKTEQRLYTVQFRYPEKWSGQLRTKHLRLFWGGANSNHPYNVWLAHDKPLELITACQPFLC